MIELLSITFGSLTALAYVLVGALEVRRAHRLAGALFITAGVLDFTLMCGWRVAVHGGLLTSSGNTVFAGNVYGVVNGLAMGGLALTGLVMLARRLDELRGPARF
jgi:hypothetical protein